MAESSNQCDICGMSEADRAHTEDYHCIGALRAEIERLQRELESMTKDRDYHRDAAISQSAYWRTHYEAELKETARVRDETLRPADETKPALGRFSGKCARCGDTIEVGWVLCSWCGEHEGKSEGQK